ncbi:CDP-diacylglycerol--serine O-phosphatidyltransferase [Gracilibacillus sp. S3-1-1]|uniref:CDP-diacylglycerol--serine O-phosphatidyltransferase n=1 Tax=Gracilibacillus pellucidus TaxID=3095368 RepID=A0ACC6M336_9BACI|nr:CDP-diacylglycerol--serine O-phosphatidyltransferase [Gracilibacillus sp. S3-1-1]MDX8045293.1 CDP-diacylglycerol--serine O-phosphatidyltransferase [Gracilibacillus sp. S3-1-1]
MNIRKHIPNSITLGNMYCGFLSMGFTVHHYYRSAAALILIGMLLDALDGRVARRLNVKSEIGKQLDSLADIVTFGIAPTILFAYTNAIEGGMLDFVLTGLFILCGGYRLARFNVDTSEDLSHFSGVPITAAGGLLAFSTLFHAHISAIGNIVIICILSYLMVSTWKIPSFKTSIISKQ